MKEEIEHLLGLMKDKDERKETGIPTTFVIEKLSAILEGNYELPKEESEDSESGIPIKDKKGNIIGRKSAAKRKLPVDAGKRYEG